MSQKIKSILVNSLSVIIIATFFVVAIIYAWTEPTQAPPGGNVVAPLNVGTTTQWKLGGLGLGLSPFVLGQGEFAASIFRDTDNSAWYVNPAGTTVLKDNLGIGTTIPGAKLHIHEGSVLQTPSSTPLDVGGIDLGVSGLGVHVSGRYAYVVHDNVPGNDFRIFDISNPANPTFVGGADLGAEGRGVHVSGRYAYVVHWNVHGPGHEFRIIDISNPASPTFVGGIDLGATGEAVHVSGRYAYVAAGNDLRIIDISNPANPVSVGGINLGRDVWDIHVSVRYAYAVGEFGFRIIDISNPAAPVAVGSIHLGGWGYGVYVSGRYAYIVHFNTPGNNFDFSIIDISNPAAPVIVGGIDLKETGLNVYVSGRYAYVVHVNVPGPDFRIIDISNPTAPVIVSGFDLGAWGWEVYVSGRYAYVVHFNVAGVAPEFRIFDISGLEVVSGMVHSLEAGSLQVREDALIHNNLSVTGGLNVGTGGIYSAGPVGVFANSGAAALTVTQSGTGNILNLFDGPTRVLTVLDGGNVGIGTTAPEARLEVTGGIRMNTTETRPTCNEARRGTLWFTRAAAGKDSLSLCATNEAGALDWRTIY